MDHLNSLVKNIEDVMRRMPGMVAPMKEELEAAQKGLMFLRDFFGFIAKRCSELEKLKDILILVDSMSCLFYLRSINHKMNDQLVKEMKTFFSSMVHRFSPAVQPEVRKMYIEALKASKSTQSPGDFTVMVDEFDLRFLDSLQHNILELSDVKLSFMSSNYKDQILSLHEELRLLTISFAMYKSSEEPLDQISNYFLEHINAAIVDLACLVIYLFCGNNEQNTGEEVAKELMIAVSGLQNIIRITKEEARKAYDMYIPKSWQLKIKFQTTNTESLISSLERYLKEISSFSSERRLIQKEFGRRSYAFDTYGLPFHLSEVLQKEMQSLIEAFSKLIAKQHSEHGEQLEIQMTRLNDFRNQTESLLSSLWRQGSQAVWRRNLWMFVLIEDIRMIKLEFEDLQNQMMHDTSASKLHRKMNNSSQGKKTFNTNMGLLGIDQGTDLDLIVPLKDEDKALRLKADFLNVFLSCKEKGHIEDGKMIFFHTCTQSADQDLQSLYSDLSIQNSPKEGCFLAMNMDCLLSEACTTFSKSSRFISGNSDEALKKNINTLLENIDVLLKCNAKLIAPFKEELEAVQKSLRFLRNFLGFTAKRCGELGKLKDLLIHSEFLVGNTSCLLYLCCNNEKMNDQIVNEMKMHLSSELQKFSPAQPDVREIYIDALKASKSSGGNSVVVDEFDLGFLDSLREDILELSDASLSFVTSNKDEILSLQEEMKFLITFFAMDISLEEHEQIFNNLFECINAVIIDIGLVIYSLQADEINEKMAGELGLKKKVSDSLAGIVVAKEYARKLYDLYEPKSLPSDFPRTNGQGFIGSLLRNLNELLISKPNLAAPLKHPVEIIQKELLSLREDFSRIAKQLHQCDEFQSQWTRFLGIAYQIEFIIDSFLVGCDPIYSLKLGLFNVVEEINTIKIELRAIKSKMTNDTLVHKPSQTVEANFPKVNAVLSSKESLVANKLVIFKEEAEKIKEQLENGSPKLTILSIVGMPGIGKTTLAGSVFQNSSITKHFHVLARCSVSQVHDTRRLLIELLQQVTVESKQYSDDDDLDKMFYQSLKGRRYLILLDDIWDIRAWKDLKSCFPDDENWSRIIFTSRFDDIATRTGLENINYSLSPLSDDKSWEMLQVKLFGNKSCSEELVSVGREIAANCKGLPLTVDLVAGVLRAKERKEWDTVAKRLKTLLLEDTQGQCRKVLELSYQDLSDDLKQCFLYFAAFPEDANVPTRDLIFLWIAEGFVQLERGELGRLEEVAENMLNNLISRSLITVSARRPSGGVDASRIHDLLYEFVGIKAQEESFMLKIDDKATFHASSINNSWQEQYRLCGYPGNWGKFLESNPSGPRTRVLISTYTPFSLNFRAFKLLRVLYIGKVSFRCSPEMFTLIHLRVLAIDTSEDTNVVDIISKIHKLQNLESFIMHGGRFRNPYVYMLLDKICNMVRLRHFCFEGYISLRYCSGSIWKMSSPLQTLHNLRASYEEDIEKILKLMPNLVELKVLFYNPIRDSYPFPKLDFLKKLESLELKNDFSSPYPKWKNINFPPSLKRLVLSNFCMQWTEISEIGNLEHLQILKLEDNAFVGPTWDMIDGQFPNLKYLSLCELDIEVWNASEDHVSVLEQLHVEGCRKLVQLPSCLNEITKLQEIKLFNCKESVVDSANGIKEAQEETGNEELVVEIQRSRFYS